ncbi:MAG: tyrosine-type recombinase/integrase [Deltaproteobacteria bacterium]|nr:tyrosine-type recombinase/integrase [Deltaproteobacteria bacterium]
MSPENVRRALRIALTKSGIQKSASTHSLRHAFATHLLESGVDIRVPQQLMGHESIRTTARYTRVSAQLVAATPSPLDQAVTTPDEMPAKPEPSEATRAQVDGGTQSPRLELRRKLAAKRTRSRKYVFEYLGRYTHRVGISNHRLLRVDNQRVSFRTKGTDPQCAALLVRIPIPKERSEGRTHLPDPAPAPI